MDNGGSDLGLTRLLPSKPIILIIRTSFSKPSMSSRLVNTVSKHWTPAARAAMHHVLPRRP